MSEEIRDILPDNPEVENPNEENPEIPSEKEESPDAPVEDDYTISEFLQSISELFTEKALKGVLKKRGLKADTLYDDLDERERDLAEAEVYYWLSNLPVGGQQVKDVDGSWSHSEGGWTVSKANIEEWYRKYSDLRKKWNEEIIGKSRIRIINL